MSKNMKRTIQLIFVFTIMINNLFAKDYYIYCTAESEDEV